MPNARTSAAAETVFITPPHPSPASKSSARMADRVSAFDWRTTPLGPIASWPESLKTAVGMCLASPVPSFVWWGNELINIYNDAYAPLLGGRHPSALGTPARKVWASVWSIIGDDVEAALKHGTSVIRDRVRFELKRRGFPNEMYFTYTFSPIPDGRGGIGGVYQVATDETARVIAEQKYQLAHAQAEQSWKEAAVKDQRLAHWQAVIANMTEGVILADADGTIVDWNQAALYMHGYTDAADVRLSIASMAERVEAYDTDGQLIPTHLWPMSRLIRGETVRNQQVRVRFRSGGPDRVLICNGTLIREADGKVRLALLTTHDATQTQPRPLENALPLQPSLHIDPLSDPRVQLKDAYAEMRADALLANLDLSDAEKDFCQSLGQQLVEQAMEEFLAANEQDKGYDGSCIAAALTIALIIVNDL